MDERSCACGLPLSGEAAGLRTSYSKLSTRSTKHVPTIRETEPTTDPMNLISNRVHCLLMVSLFRPLTFHPVANRWQHHLLVVCGWRAVSGTIKTHGSAKHFGCLMLPYSITGWNPARHITIPIYAVFAGLYISPWPIWIKKIHQMKRETLAKSTGIYRYFMWETRFFLNIPFWSF